MIYAALPGRSSDQLKSSKEVVIDDQTIKFDFISTNTNQVIEQFISKTKNQKEVTVLSSTPFDLDSELTRLIENFINSSGGSYSLVSARELNDEPKCLLSGDFLCSEVVANSSAEVVEYFKQAMRTRESLGINIAGLFTLYRNGHTLNFLISPPKSTSKNINIYSKAFFIILSGSSLDHDLVQLVRQIEARDESRKLSSRNIRKELHTLNRDIIRQSKPDQDQKTKMLDLMKKLNYTKEDEPEMRLAKAKNFMEEREGLLKQNGLIWSLNEEVPDINKTLSLEYQKLRGDLEEARSHLSAARETKNKPNINTALLMVRQKENLLAACEAKISNSSVVSLHHQLKASRDKLRMEQVEQLKKAKANNKKDSEILVNHVESQKRLIERLEDDVEVIVQQHQHFMDQLKVKQIAVMQKYRDLMENAAGDRIHRLESLLHETITDVLT